MTDPIADMLTRIRNAVLLRKTEITLPYSKLKQAVAELLQAARYIDNVETLSSGIDKQLKLTLGSEGSPRRITEITRLSRPGRRLYARADNIPVIKSGRGVIIISTSKGLMTGAQASKQRLGGELMCRIY